MFCGRGVARAGWGVLEHSIDGGGACGSTGTPMHRLSLLLLMSSLHASPLNYPAAVRSDLKETLHGVEIADPYRGLEEIDSAETRQWVEAEAKLAGDYLGALPQRAAILEGLKKLMNYDRIGLPHVEGGRIFRARKTGLQNQGVLYWKESETAAERVLLDPNKLAADGTAALSGWHVSRDGKRVAYGISLAGSDWNECRFRDVASGEDLPDVLKWVKFSQPSWNHEGSAVYYSRYAAPKEGQELKEKNLNQKMYVHQMGEAQEQDRLLYERPDQPEWGLGGGETDDGRYLLIHVSKGTAPENGLFYRDLTAGAEGPIVELFKDFDAEYSLVGNDGPIWYLITTKDAPNRKLVAVDLAHPSPKDWRTILPEQPGLLSQVAYLGGRFVVTRLVDAHDEVTVHEKDGKVVQKLELPGFGNVSGFGGKQEDTTTHYFLTGFTTPGEIYHFDVTTCKSTLEEETKVAFDPRAYETEQVFYKSKDGTRIPMFLCHKKGLERNGLNPTLLTADGGFNISLTPAFSPSTIAWMEMGGVFTQPNLRGGGEYGQAWHEGGRRLEKQRVFEDFIAAAEWLIAEKITSTPKLAIYGGSNGGLLVGACLNQRPELFGAAVPAVGVHDMLRFHKFTIGWAWEDEFGSPNDPVAFANILKYSPLHNIRKIAYPPTLILTGDHDDRVFPAHSFKYAATLQQAQAGPAPILLRVDLKAGHGAGKPTSKQIDETADKYAFLAEALGMKVEIK